MCGMNLAGFYSRLELCNGRIHRVTKMVFGGISKPGGRVRWEESK